MVDRSKSLSTKRVASMPTNLGTKRIACIWLPNWPIQRLLHARPELKRKRIGIVDRGNRPPATARVIAANVPGVVGLPVAEVAIELLPYDAEADRQALEQLALWCDRFSPVVGIETANIDSCKGLAHAGASVATRSTRPAD